MRQIISTRLQCWAVGGVGLLLLYAVVVWKADTDADAFYHGDLPLQMALAKNLIAFEAEDDHQRHQNTGDRFDGEWALVTHQMVALGLAQVYLAHPEQQALIPIITKAALKSFLPEMRDFGTEAWGEDALKSLDQDAGHAYLGYSAMALGMARCVDPDFPPDIAQQQDALMAAYARRLMASPTGLIETYPQEAYPTDVAAVAAALALHSRATSVDHHAVLSHWAQALRQQQIDPSSGYVFQRMGALDGRPHDLPRGSGTGLAAYYAGFVDRELAAQLAQGLFAHHTTYGGLGGIAEYPEGMRGWGDIDSGPVILGISVAATGFSLAPARALQRPDIFQSLYRSAGFFGLPVHLWGELHFYTGGAIGNALLLAMLSSGPELAPVQPNPGSVKEAP